MQSQATQFGRVHTWTGPSAIALVALTVAGLYLLLHPYLGITHDARLYTLQALNYLHPELYGNDIFLRFGSQDDYTLFTPLYGWMISWLGVEPAAALLTLISQLAFLAAAALLCRSLLPTASTWLAIALLLLLPDHYGPSRIFSYLEEFVTPRQLAESLVLFAVVAFMRGRRVLTAALLALSLLSHPIIGIAGLALVASLVIVLPNWRKLLPLAALFSLALMLAAIMGWLPSSWRFDEEWLGIVLARAEYLHLSNWTTDDWGRVATVAATLAIAARMLTGNIQRVLIATLISTATLMSLALIGGDLLNIKLIVQAQPWRVLWLATVIAVLVLPALFRASWASAGLKRSGALILASAWLSPSESMALLMAPLAIAATTWNAASIDKQNTRRLLHASYAVLAIVFIHALSVSLLSIQAGTYKISVSPWLDSLRNASTGGVLPLLLLFVGYWIVKSTPRIGGQLLAVVVALPVAATTTTTADTWLDTTYDKNLRAAFSDWRARIPPGSDVMWATDPAMDSVSTTSVWLLLERPSFVSRIQSTTSLFSREAALEMRNRTQSLLGLLPDIKLLYPPDVEPTAPDPLVLAPVCGSSAVKYIVTSDTFVDAIPIDAPTNVRAPFRYLKLYICP